MTALVCTAWDRPPGLWALTMDDHVVDQGDDVCTPYVPSLDVWSFGAVIYEVLSGETLGGRAGNGTAMVQAVADIIGACPTEPAGAFACLEYARDEL